jgi:hypothetical protein
MAPSTHRSLPPGAQPDNPSGLAKLQEPLKAASQTAGPPSGILRQPAEGRKNPTPTAYWRSLLHAIWRSPTIVSAAVRQCAPERDSLRELHVLEAGLFE